MQNTKRKTYQTPSQQRSSPPPSLTRSLRSASFWAGLGARFAEEYDVAQCPNVERDAGVGAGAGAGADAEAGIYYVERTHTPFHLLGLGVGPVLEATRLLTLSEAEARIATGDAKKVGWMAGAGSQRVRLVRDDVVELEPALAVKQVGLLVVLLMKRVTCHTPLRTELRRDNDITCPGFFGPDLKSAHGGSGHVCAVDGVEFVMGHIVPLDLDTDPACTTRTGATYRSATGTRRRSARRGAGKKVGGKDHPTEMLFRKKVEFYKEKQKRRGGDLAWYVQCIRIRMLAIFWNTHQRIEDAVVHIKELATLMLHVALAAPSPFLPAVDEKHVLTAQNFVRVTMIPHSTL
ncbi:hypothetical protein C8R44DRAFT_747947 [Mycena epipterygia]|nr:hypothetical protein C8R44DRAFT_747947 [Mycena epipterygia]